MCYRSIGLGGLLAHASASEYLGSMYTGALADCGVQALVMLPDNSGLAFDPYNAFFPSTDVTAGSYRLGSVGFPVSCLLNSTTPPQIVFGTVCCIVC